MVKCVRTFCRLFLCGALGCCLTASPALVAAPRADEKPRPTAASPMTDEQMMAEMTKLATPGPNHELLKKFVGAWKTVTKMWMAPGDPQTTEGATEYAMILGGRFLKQEFKGTFMGGPFEGFGLTGFDNKKGKFITFWSDTAGTGWIDTEGTWNAASKELTFKGAYDLVGPATPYRMVTKLVDDNTHTFSWYEMKDGKEVRTLEITYTRM